MTLKILIVDDRVDPRNTLRELIELHLPASADISVEATFPLGTANDYPSFIRENDIAALLLDERLNEVGDPDTGSHVPYMGHDVVSGLRACLPDFPVYVVTTYRSDADLVDKEDQFEDVVERTEFQRNPEKYTNRIQRAASRFQEAMRQQLEVLADLTSKAANGLLTQDEKGQLSAVRQMLGLPFTADEHFVMSDLIAKAKVLVAESELLLSKLEDKGDKP